jgi:cytochrome c
VTQALTVRTPKVRAVQCLLWLAAAGAVALLGVAASAGLQSAADARRGQKVFQQCYACHSVDRREAQLPGPNLAGVIGRTAGTLASFQDYSEAMQAAGRGGLVWNTHTLDVFLEDPERLVPGTSMNFVGLRAKQDREDVIAYVQKARP